MITTSRNSVQASWSPTDCAEHYIIRVKKSLPEASHDHNYLNQMGTKQVNEGSGHVTPFLQNFTDDEDYDSEGSSSGELPVTVSPQESKVETHDTGFNFGYNLILDRKKVENSKEEEDYFDTSTDPDNPEASLSYDYYDVENKDETVKLTTPTSLLSDDDDYQDTESGVEVDDLEYYNESIDRKKRSASDEDSGIKALLALDDFSYENGLNDDEYIDEMDDIESILSLDKENYQNNEENFISIVDTTSGEIKGLDPCSSYTLDVQAVYDYNVKIDSEKKEFNTLCQASCDTSNLDFRPSFDEGSNEMTIKIEKEPDCVQEYAFKYCIQQTCKSEYNLKSTNSELVISGAVQPCLEYDFFLMPISDKTELNRDEENEWDNAIHKIINFKSSHETPISTDYSVGGLSHQNVNISWMKPNECVDGYRISVYEIRHLPNLLLQYVDEKNEPLTSSIKLSSKETSLMLSNLSSCRLHRIEIESIYTSDKGKNIVLLLFP